MTNAELGKSSGDASGVELVGDPGQGQRLQVDTPASNSPDLHAGGSESPENDCTSAGPSEVIVLYPQHQEPRQLVHMLTQLRCMVLIP